MSNIHHGSCLCGKVNLSVYLDKTDLSACHCNMCRKWGAGPLMTVEHHGTITVNQGKEFIQNFSSSAWAERAFCNQCGTHLYYHLKNTQDYYIAAWLFDDIETMDFNSQVYIDKKPDYYRFANQTHNLTEDDILKMVSDIMQNND